MANDTQVAKRIVKRPSGASQLTEEMFEREFLWRKWFPKDLVFTADGMTDEEVDLVCQAFKAFCEDNFWVKVPGGRERLELRPAQLETLRDIVANRNTIILKARQVGFSTLLAAFTLWCALGGRDRQIYMLSKGQREARALLSKARYGYRNLPDWVRTKAPELQDRTLERMTFDNDSFMISSQSASDPIRGETAWMAIVDEWASIPDQEGAWAAIEPTADIGGRIIGLSTAKGEGNFFHQLFVGAQAGTNQFKAVFHSWRAVPARDDEWYRLKKLQNPVWFVAQEYPDNPEEAFIGSGNPFFDLDIVRGWKVVDPLGRFRTAMNGSNPEIVEDRHGDLQIWEYPDPKKAYVIGADVAAGLDHGDWSVAFVMEAKSRKIVAMYRGHCTPSDYAENILQPLGLYYNQALLTPEVNNMGATVMSDLMRVSYPNLYRRRSKLKRKETIMESMGWLTMSNNKPDLMNGVDRWMREGGRTLDAVSQQELKGFVREQRGSNIALHGSPHDDTVMALGITVMSCKYAVDNGYSEPVFSNAGSIDWWVSRLGKDKGKKRRLSPVL